VEEIIRVQDQHYIIASSDRLNDRVRVLKHGDSFAVLDEKGDILPLGHGEQGLYHEGTRYLSRLEFRLQDRPPHLLSSAVKEQVAVLSVNLTNPDIFAGDLLVMGRNALHVTRTMLLLDGACHEEFRIRNFALLPAEVRIDFTMDADFSDIFEVRGFKRMKKGRILPPVHDREEIILAYEGLDGHPRRLRVRASPIPDAVEDHRIRYQKRLLPREEEVIHLAFFFEPRPERSPQPTFREALRRCHAQIRETRDGDARLSSSNASFNEWLTRSTLDLHMMFTRTPYGLYPYAGIPWFSTPFGRDGLISALQYLWISPQPARGVLSYLAATQATELNPERDAEPGKILHESRKGELAALNEIPFGQYYGSVDATPLFVMLAGAYYERTGERAFIETLWPNIRRALAWIDTYGDPDQDGFVEYCRKSSSGLVNQGWKDSYDAIFHADGTLAEGPVALSEVQAYVYGARRRGAELASLLGEERLAGELRTKADLLQARFEERFWCDELSTYGLALDGNKRLCRVRTSNAGHALLTRLADSSRAARLSELLLGETFFSGWGVRTVAASESRYNPMSYHNGSVWPHDTALLALGMSQYPFPKTWILRLFSGLFHASVFTDLHRLPELYCGFRRKHGEGPTLYPVACSPQAWASGSLFMLIQAALGLVIDGIRGQIEFRNPALPEWLEELTVQGLSVGRGSVDLEIHRHPHDVEINVVNRTANVRVLIVK
jgi:glycogen debranching enzyme